MAEREDLGARPDRADDVSRPIRRLELVARPPGDLGGDLVVLEDAVGHVGFGHHDLVRAEGVGLDRVAADRQERLVDLLDHLRPGEVQHFGDVLLPHPVALEIERAQSADWSPSRRRGRRHAA